MIVSKEQALSRVVRRIYPRADETVYGPNGLVALLKDEASVRLRNAAAHDQVLDRAAAEAVRSWAFKVLRLL